MDCFRAVCFLLACAGSYASGKWDSNFAALLVSGVQTFVDMAVGEYQALSDPANKYRWIIKLLIMLLTLPFVYLAFADGISVAAFCDGTMLALVAIHLGYQVRVGLKDIDAFTWNEECQYGKA